MGNIDTVHLESAEIQTSDRQIAGTLKQGESATIFVGAVNATFKVQLFGRITATAQIDVDVDNSVVTTLTPSSRATVVNGQRIVLTSRGAEAQTFLATQL